MQFKAQRIFDLLLSKQDFEKSGNIAENKYSQLIRDLSLLLTQPGTSHEESMLIIENDIPRTFPTLEFYNDETA